MVSLPLLLVGLWVREIMLESSKFVCFVQSGT